MDITFKSTILMKAPRVNRERFEIIICSLQTQWIQYIMTDVLVQHLHWYTCSNIQQYTVNANSFIMCFIRATYCAIIMTDSSSCSSLHCFIINEQQLTYLGKCANWNWCDCHAIFPLSTGFRWMLSYFQPQSQLDTSTNSNHCFSLHLIHNQFYPS